MMCKKKCRINYLEPGKEIQVNNGNIKKLFWQLVNVVHSFFHEKVMEIMNSFPCQSLCCSNYAHCPQAF